LCGRKIAPNQLTVLNKELYNHLVEHVFAPRY